MTATITKAHIRSGGPLRQFADIKTLVLSVSNFCINQHACILYTYVHIIHIERILSNSLFISRFKIVGKSVRSLEMHFTISHNVWWVRACHILYACRLVFYAHNRHILLVHFKFVQRFIFAFNINMTMMFAYKNKSYRSISTRYNQHIQLPYIRSVVSANSNHYLFDVKKIFLFEFHFANGHTTNY